MTNYVLIRCKWVAEYIAEKKCTVREVAKIFGIPKSTVHKDITERIIKVNAELARKVREVLNKNKEERAIRGGMATKQKYAKACKQPPSHL